MRFLKHILFLWIGSFAIFTSCNKDDRDDSPPVLSKVPIDFSMLDTAIVFGQELGSDKKSPALEYILGSPEVAVNAIASGYVETIVLNEGILDYEVRMTKQAIQLNKRTNGPDLAYCPLNYATLTFIENTQHSCPIGVLKMPLHPKNHCHLRF